MLRLCTMILAAGMLVSAAGAEANVSSGNVPTHPHSAKTPANVTKTAAKSDSNKIGSKKRRNVFVGVASWYGRDFQGRPTASGEPYDMHDLTAASKTLPLGSYAKVTNLKNGRWVLVRINDRGPMVAGRIIDLSYQAAHMLNMAGSGIGKVRIEPVAQPDDSTDTIATVFPQDQPQ